MQIGLSPLQAGGNFEETLMECERAEALGFDSVWLGEHHNSSFFYPTPLIGLAAIASRTHRLRLGTGVLLLPLYHPVAVAEEGAMVDMMSGGRLILGVGAGYAPGEFAAFGVSSKERGSRLEEGASLLHRLWTEEKVTHRGRHYQVTDVTVGPRPVQQPRPPLWFAACAEPAIRRAARLGDAWSGGPSARLDEYATSLWPTASSVRMPWPEIHSFSFSRTPISGCPTRLSSALRDHSISGSWLKIASSSAIRQAVSNRSSASGRSWGSPTSSAAFHLPVSRAKPHGNRWNSLRGKLCPL